MGRGVNAKVVNVLIEHRADLGRGVLGTTVLHAFYGSRSKHYDVIDFILQQAPHVADVADSFFGFSAWMMCMAVGNTDLFQHLLAHHRGLINLHIRDLSLEGISLCGYAARFGYM